MKAFTIGGESQVQHSIPTSEQFLKPHPIPIPTLDLYINPKESGGIRSQYRGSCKTSSTALQHPLAERHPKERETFSHFAAE